MEALQYLKDKYGSNDNSLYFREPDLPLSTSLERICKYMQEYAVSHTAAHTAALQERVKELEEIIVGINSCQMVGITWPNELKQKVEKILEAAE